MMKKATFILFMLLIAALHGKNGDTRKKIAPKTEPTKTAQESDFKRYFGLEAMYGTGKEKKRVEHSSFSDERLSYSEISFKLGFGAYDKNRVELALTQNKTFVMNKSSASSDFASGMSADIAYLVFLDILDSAASHNILPFIKIGTGLARFDIKEEYKSEYGSDSIYATELKLGLGVSSVLKKRIELSLFYNTISREFQTIENYDSRLMEISHEINSLSFGANYRF